MTEPVRPMTYSPAPAARPIAAVAHRLAAVVRPRIEAPSLMIAPAPRKPMPDTIWAATRDGSMAAVVVGWKAKIDSSVKIADPRATRRCVRIPAGWP